VKHGTTYLIGREGQVALISLNGPDEPHLGPPHPHGPGAQFSSAERWHTALVLAMTS